MSNAKWIATLRLYNENEQQVGSFQRVILAPTFYDATVAAQNEATRLCKAHKADFWTVSVN